MDARPITKLISLLVIIGSFAVAGYFSSRLVFSGLPESSLEFVSSDAVARAREFPVEIAPTTHCELPASLADNAGTFSFFPENGNLLRLPKNATLSPSLCLHLIKLCGRDTQVEIEGADPPDRIGLWDTLLSESASKKYFGHSSLVATRDGIRFPTLSKTGIPTAGDESHRDQCLATLGEWGVPLSKKLSVGGHQYTLRDVLKDSVANFHLTQGELEWTAMAYAFYMPDAQCWTNRYGEEFTFDDLAVALMEHPLKSASCGGTHYFTALNVLIRADQETGMLSEDVRGRVLKYLRKMIRHAVKVQQLDGSWAVDWNHGLLSLAQGEQPPVQRDNLEARVLMTGHLAELMLYLPAEIEVPPSVLRRAGIWLDRQVHEATNSLFWENLCPFVHASCAVRLRKDLVVLKQ